MAVKSGFKRDHEFPNESFVQETIERYFSENGFDLTDPGFADLKCINRATGDVWLIEAKGKTAQMGLDFRTCLGQIIQRMERPEWMYAIALPNLPEYHDQCNKVPDWVRKILKIKWIFVSESGRISIQEHHE